LWIVCLLGTLSSWNLCWNFLLTVSSRSIFHTGVIQKYALLWSILHHNRTHCSLITTENKWLMEMITAAYCWQIINSHTWTALLAVKHNAIKRSTTWLLPFIPNIIGFLKHRLSHKKLVCATIVIWNIFHDVEYLTGCKKK
jgi:hypothetical protein